MRYSSIFSIALLSLGLSLGSGVTTTAYAQAVPTQATPVKIADNDAVIISSNASAYSLAGKLRQFESNKENPLSFAQVASRYKGGQGKKVESSLPRFTHDGKNGHWIVFSAYNRSQSKVMWMLDLGLRGDGSFGNTNVISVYSNAAAEQPVSAGGRTADTLIKPAAQGKNAIPLRLEAGENRIIGVYIDPAPGTPVTIAPRLVEQTVYAEAHDNDSIRDYAFFIVAALAALSFFLMWRNSGYKKPIPAQLAVYTATLAAICHSADDILPVANSFMTIYAPVLKAVAAFSAVSLAQHVLVSGSKTPRFALGFAIARATAGILGAVCLLFGDAIGFVTGLLNMFALPAATVFITIVAFSIATSTQRPQAKTFAAAWILAAMGAVISLAAAMGLTGSVAMTYPLYTTLAIPHIILLAYASLRFINITERMILQEKQNQKRKQEEEAEIRKTREMADQSRLLGIMQREKELIDDLRTREAERAQAMRKAKEVADQANKAKSDFLAVISHEIRTPMTGIMGMIRLMLDTQLDERQKEFARTIQYSGETLLTLLNDILDLSKVEQGKMSLEIIDFDIVRLTQSVAMLMSGRADEKRISIKADIDPKVPVALKGDPTRLRQILLNLVGNAIKFTEQGGVTITIRLQERTPDGKCRVYFAVSDTGIGIPPDAQKKLFQPYAQADSSTARKFGGTGLGLSICKKLIEAMGSTIQLKSEPGKGTTFFYTLTMDEGTLRDEDNATKPQNADAIIPLRILVVDDNIINQRVVAGLLEKDRHKIITVGSAKEAFAEIDKEIFDVILMDMEMPEIDGVTATKMIRDMKDAAKSKQPIVAMTGNTAQEDIDRCKKAGMNDFLTKPINQEQMRKVLQDIGAKSGKKAEDKVSPLAIPAAATAVSAEKPAAAEIPPKSTPALASPAAPVIKQTAEVPPYVPAPPAKSAAVTDTYVPMPPPAASSSGSYIPAPPPKTATEATAPTQTTAPVVSPTGGYVPVPPPAAPKTSGDAYVPVPPPAPVSPTTAGGGYVPVPPPAAPKTSGDAYVPVPPPTPVSAAAAGSGYVPVAAPATPKKSDDAYVPVPPPSSPSVTAPAAATPVQMPPGIEPYVPVPPPSAQTSTAQEQKKPMFDAAMLGSLKDSLGGPALADMMKDLYTKTEELIGSAEKALVDGDYTALYGRGHDIKGMTANFGITVLSQLAGRLERQAKDKQSLEELAILVKQLRPTYTDTRAELDSWISG